MKFVKTLLFFLSLSFLGSLNAQDIHFSQFYCSPLTLNPALTGNFQGTFRIGGIYRDQWASVINNPYRTPSIYVDAPIIQGFRKQDWVGIGGMVYNDEAGSGSLTKTSGMLSVAYHMAMDKKRKSMLTFGLQGGFGQRRVDLMSSINPDGSVEGLVFEDELELGGNLGIGSGADRSSIAANNSFIDINAGVALTSQINKQAKVNVGLALRHINTPADYNFIQANTNPQTARADSFDLNMQVLLHGKFDFDLNDKWTISPAFLYNAMGSADEPVVQAMAGYHFNPDLTLKFGVGYRLRDATEILLGVDYKNVHVGLAYDVNVSPLNEVSNYNGGFEICANYIAKIYKEPTVKPVIFCPRF